MSPRSTKWPASLLCLLVTVGCGGAGSEGSGPPANATPSTPPCDEAAGPWSEPVDGLRGRLVASRDGDVRLAVELENLGAQPVAIHWDGPVLGFVTFRLDDAEGAEVTEPHFAPGGNEAVGSLVQVIPASGTARRDIGNGFERIAGVRVLRIGVFWVRAMSTDGTHRFLRGRVSGREARPDDHLVRVEDDGSVLVADEHAPPDARTWTGPLELPPICVE